MPPYLYTPGCPCCDVIEEKHVFAIQHGRFRSFDAPRKSANFHIYRFGGVHGETVLRYPDSTISLKYSRPRRAATTENISLSGEQTVDGVALVDGDHVLVKDQIDASENGAWQVKTGSWIRPFTDPTAPDNWTCGSSCTFSGTFLANSIGGYYSEIEEGGVNGGKIFVCDVPLGVPFEIGVDDMPISELTDDHVTKFNPHLESVFTYDNGNAAVRGLAVDSEQSVIMAITGGSLGTGIGKLDKHNQLLWTYDPDPSNNGHVSSIAVTKDDKIWVAGGGSVRLLSPDGNLITTVHTGSFFISSVRADTDPDGNLCVSYSSPNRAEKYDQSGNVIWSHDFPSGIIANAIGGNTHDGGAVVGVTDNNNRSAGIVAHSIDSNGDFVDSVAVSSGFIGDPAAYVGHSVFTAPYKNELGNDRTIVWVGTTRTLSFPATTGVASAFGLLSYPNLSFTHLRRNGSTQAEMIAGESAYYTSAVVRGGRNNDGLHRYICDAGYRDLVFEEEDPSTHPSLGPHDVIGRRCWTDAWAMRLWYSPGARFLISPAFPMERTEDFPAGPLITDMAYKMFVKGKPHHYLGDS